MPRSIYEGARDMAREIARSWEGRVSRRLRKKIEMLFAHLKRILKLDRLRLRGPNGAFEPSAKGAVAAAVDHIRARMQALRPLRVDHLDQNLSVLNEDRIGLDWHHRGRPDHLTGPDVEHPGVEIALDPAAVDQTVGQRAGSVRAGIVDDAKFTVEVENGKNQASSFHSESATTSHVICAA